MIGVKLELGRPRHHLSGAKHCNAARKIKIIMNAPRKRLPQLDGGLFLTDGGIETDLIFNDGMELPHFAAFDLLETEKGTAALRAYYRALCGDRPGATASASSWRARPGAPAPTGADKLGYSPAALAEANAKAIALMVELRQRAPEQRHARW